jgi:hypothetical protein
MRRKTLYIAVCCVGVSLHAGMSASVKDIEKMVELIHLKRPGISLDKLDKTPDPFVVMKKDENKTVIEKPKMVEDVKLELHALMGEKAFIDGAWRKLGDVVKGYKIVHIGKRGVVLRKGNTIRTLFIKKHIGKQGMIKLVERD